MSGLLSQKLGLLASLTATIVSMFKDVSLSALNAGFVTVLVGFTSSAVIIMQAAQSLGAPPEVVGSWMWALGIGMGVTCIGLSLRYRAPLATAWSTAGAAMLISVSGGVTLPEAVGAFIISGALITLVGFSGWFEYVFSRVPLSIAAGMLSGVLLRFGLDAFTASKTALGLVLAMFFSYLFARRLVPRYSVLIALVVGMAITAAQGTLHVGEVHLQLATPVLIVPEFTWQSVIGVALPLFLVTMASQNVPAVAVLRASDFAKVPVSPLIGWTGLVTTILAPFGAFALNMATITAAICVGREAHEDPGKRYMAAVFAGVFYTLTGLFGATIAALFVAFPTELVHVLAGLALLGTIGSGLSTALKDESQREPALVTFLVTAGGVSLFGIGSAFWGLVAGAVAMLILSGFRRMKQGAAS
jgi:benzoate membrane transport protein